jgi:hypothetical protein
MKKRIMLLFMVLIAVCLIYVPVNVIAAATAPHVHYDECDAYSLVVYQGNTTDGSDSPKFQEIKSALPAGTPAKNVKGMGFNFRLWHDKGLVVYGTYNSINSTRNDFKEGRKGGGEPYYLKNGVRGEYRYHGYDTLGNLVTNVDFPDDINSAVSLTKRQWISLPWKSPLVLAAPKTGTLQASDYNKAAIENSDLFTRAWINNGIPELIGGLTNAVDGFGNTSSDRNLYDFINILSAPTPRFNGEGRMWRLAENGNIYYQTFSVNKYKKNHTPVNVTVTVTNPNDLKFEDYGADNPSSWATTNVTAKVTVTAELADSGYFGDNIKKATYYTRFDIKNWQVGLTTDVAGSVTAYGTPQVFDNIAKYTYKVTLTKAQWKAKASVPLYATATANYLDSEKDTGNKTANALATTVPIADITPAPAPVTPTPTEAPPPEGIDIKVTIPNPAFDIVPIKATDNTTMTNGTIVSRILYINNQPVDYNTFFSGNYTFGIGNDGLKKIDIIYTSATDIQYLYTGWTYVYDTKPNAQFSFSGSFKQNRLMKANDTSASANVALVVSAYPITSYQWSYTSVSGDITTFKSKDISSIYKELMYKTPGVYEIQLVVTNSLGRTSDPYVLRFEIFPDYAPAVDINLNATDIARGDTLTAYNYGAVSTDGDTIASNVIELWYDSNNDGTYDTKLQTWDGKNGFPSYTPTKLGFYKYVNIVTESFGEATMPEYITAADTVTKTVEREFVVDNYIPMTDLYVDIPIERPKVDSLFIEDSALNATSSDYLQNNRMDIDNSLRAENVEPTVTIWDTHTYTYSQAASTTSNTGSSYPASTISYSSGGYSGTLSLTSVSNAKYTVDNGYYATQTETKTATASDSQTGTYCYLCGSVPAKRSTTAPYSYSDSQGFSGSLPLTYNYSEAYTANYCSIHKTTKIRSFSRTWSWSGTVSRSVQVWVPNLVTYNNYTGFYSGTIYKSVSQPYTDTFTPDSYKYIIYVSDGTISQLTSLKNLMSTTDAKLVLIGPDTIKTQIAYDYFIRNDRPIADLVSDAVKIMTENNPAVPKFTLVAGVDTFNMNAVTVDAENDPITEQKYEYVQDASYFDNSNGMDANAVSTYSSSAGWTTTKLSSFTKVGKYDIYTRAKDRPSTDPNFANYSYYSGTPHITVYVHRKPFAVATLDWDYDTATSTYKTTWVDKSYDLDHNITRADKGIVERKIMFRKDGGAWQYFIPANLTYGTYELQYYVKDLEGAWSDPFTLTFTLSSIPPIQFKAELQSMSVLFGIDSAVQGTNTTAKSIPSTEVLTAYDLWTRFPYNVSLEMGFWNGTSYITTPTTITYSTSTGTKTGNDINWYDKLYPIPAKKSDGTYLSDGIYSFKVKAIGDYSQTAEKIFQVKILTPINLSPSMVSSMVAGKSVTISAITSRYASSVKMTLNKGTAYATTVSMSLYTTIGSQKIWKYTYTVPSTLPNGSYTAEFTATAVNGGTETKTCPYTVITNSPPTVSIISTSPGMLYESDDASAVLAFDDPDNDTLNAHLELLQGGTVISSQDFTVTPVSGVYSNITKLMKSNISVGSYQINITVTDPYGASASDTYSFTVSGLGISGSVSHTALWDQHRQKYNLSKSGTTNSPRASTDFFPGEKFVIMANTSSIGASRPDLYASQVTCTIDTTSFGNTMSSPNRLNWTGSIWDKSMGNWHDRQLKFIFTVTYSNGAVKASSAIVNIVDDEYWRLHMKF